MKQVFLESHNLQNRYSGFGQFNYHLIRALATFPQEDFQITVHSKDIKTLEKEFGAVFKYRKYHSLTRHRPFQIKKRYDLWHCLNQNIKIEPFFDIPYVLTVHDIHFVKEGSLKQQKKRTAQFRKKLQRATAITYISHFTKDDVHAHFKVPDIPEYVIYNGNTIPEISSIDRDLPEILPEQPFLFSIGDFSERKNFLSLVELLQFLPDYDLVLAGNNQSAYAKNLTEKARQLGLENRVFQTGKISEAHKQYYFKHCEGFVFPSLREGFGIPPIEAMTFGKPVFLSNSTSLPEIGGEYSFYWDHYEPEYMAKVIKNGLRIFHSEKDFYQNWYKNRAKSFSWKTTAEKYLEVYRELL